MENQRLDLDVRAVREAKKEIYDKMIDDELDLKPGAGTLVEACAAEFRLAVVSSSRRESIEGCLAKFGLARYFSEFVSGADLPRSKPYPDAYLKALEIMRVSSAAALALEDSVTGFRAADAAGIGCLVCPDHFIPKPAGAFDDAALIVDSLLEVDPGRLRSAHAAKGAR